LNNAFLTIIFALVAAAWGTGDFNGGTASKRSSVHAVVLISQFTGIGLLLLFIPFLIERPLLPGICRKRYWQD